MTLPASQIAACVSGYAARLHAVVGPKHHVVSALGAWLLLALVGPASEGADRAALTDVLGCDVDDAAQAAANLLTHPHPLVASAAAVWTSPAAPLPDTFVRWRDALPGVVTADDLPSQTELDAWARDHTFGLIDRFPVTRTDDLYLILATALATKVSWQVPFDHAPAASLGASSPWAGTLDCVLRTPRARSGGHAAFITTAAEAGEVIAHIAEAAGGLDVVSVAAMPDVPPGRVLAAAYDIAVRHATAAPIESRDLAGLTPGEHALWTVREVRAAADSCAAVLPAWSATSRLDLSAPGLGFDAAGHALVRNDDAWQALQEAMARYTTTGFEAAAASALLPRSVTHHPATHREVTLRFGHPYATVAVTTNSGGPWHGLPVFSAWVSEPESPAADDGPGGRL